MTAKELTIKTKEQTKQIKMICGTVIVSFGLMAAMAFISASPGKHMTGGNRDDYPLAAGVVDSLFLIVTSLIVYQIFKFASKQLDNEDNTQQSHIQKLQ